MRARDGLIVFTVAAFGDFSFLVGNLSYRSTVLSDSSEEKFMIGLSAYVFNSCEDMLNTTVSESLS